jgi:hypothetical protein
MARPARPLSDSFMIILFSGQQDKRSTTYPITFASTLPAQPEVPFLEQVVEHASTLHRWVVQVRCKLAGWALS